MMHRINKASSFSWFFTSGRRKNFCDIFCGPGGRISELRTMLGYMPAVLYSNESLEVKFADYNWYWVPLELLFYSSSSRVLVSRHPDSCIEEVVSFYCPQCLKRYMDDEVNRYRKHCPNCKVCPRCQSVLASIILTEDTMLLHCNYCSWECPADVKQMAVEVIGAAEMESARSTALETLVVSEGGGSRRQKRRPCGH